MATVIVGLVGSFVTIGGWIVLHYFTLGREGEARKSVHANDLAARTAADKRADRVKRLEISLSQVERQISQFYGPLNGLIYEIWATWDVKERIRTATAAENSGAIDHFVGNRFFTPMHEKMRTLIRERIHLVEGETIPKSFYDYLRHSVMENIQITLWNEQRINTSAAKGVEWSVEFPEDVAKGLATAMRRYEALLSELRASEPVPGSFPVSLSTK